MKRTAGGWVKWQGRDGSNTVLYVRTVRDIEMYLNVLKVEKTLKSIGGGERMAVGWGYLALERTPAHFFAIICAVSQSLIPANSPNRDAGRTRKVGVLIGWKFVGWVNSGWAGRVAAAWKWEWDFGSVVGENLLAPVLLLARYAARKTLCTPQHLRNGPAQLS
ncbi:hypothetical protein CISG_00301 [Coccidioides immitis RMSCC 3703]|uniref:Uncharacterized protein n=2 Tax=Coccidioides immitis TaxID=5501 RepID=A0A0J8TEL1_COCIT|nr:hypothetical protein CIRG_07238 [Coccidioides immitis RMSCC 2394]KMU71992.1 hypothetical protein CISG_00301 [Coccidioides immitis RMSCC 3703]